MPNIIVLIGAPGAGKGTQASLLHHRKGLQRISTGDIFREMRRVETPLAEEMRSIMDSGRLLSDDLVFRIVRDCANSDACSNGYVLDGFPRTAVQAEMLEQLISQQGHKTMVILIDVPLDLLEKRAVGRRLCALCGEIYNIYSRKPKNDMVCDQHPDAELTHRADDYPERIRVRLREYEEKTRPLLTYYGLSKRLRSVDGTREPEAIYSDITKLIASEF